MEVLEEYSVEADGVTVKVKILGEKGLQTTYELETPQATPVTIALLERVRHEIISEVAVTTQEILDPKVINKLKDKFRAKAESILSEKITNINANTKTYLIGTLLQEMIGLGKIEYLLNDQSLEEIVVNSAEEPIRVFHKRYGWIRTNIKIETEAQIQNYSNIIARRVGRQITTLNPLLDAHLTTGDRANAVLYPISNKGNTITIRKSARDPWTVTDMIVNKTSDSKLFALIWLAIQYEMNIIISGGTGSGKTSFLNVCMVFVPPYHRIISIEDTRELQLPEFLYWAPLTTRQPNPEGKGEITMLDLLVNSLRMRPDRIILGEMRRRAEAEVLFEAMHTGHSVYATLHADSINETITRLVNPPMEIPANQLGAVNLNVVMFRDRRRGIRRTNQIGEFVVSDEAGKVAVKPNILYRWKPTTDTVVPFQESVRFYEDLSNHTGLSMMEINKDIAIKKEILEYMVKNKLRDITTVGKIINHYYFDEDFVVKHVQSGKAPDELIK